MKVFRGTPKHLSADGKLKSFTYLMVNFPFLCNYRCPKCFNLSENKPLIRANYIDTNSRITAIKRAKDSGGKVIVIAGEGEPVLQRSTKTLVSEADTSGMSTIVYTNGSALTRDAIEFYRNRNVSFVISLDSFNPSTYDELTGIRGNLPKVMRNIEILRKAYEDTITTDGDLRVVRLALNMTLQGINEGEVSKIKKFCGDDIYFICNPIAYSGNAVTNWNRFAGVIGFEEMRERQRKIIQEFSESGGPLSLGSSGLCGYSEWGIAISPDGQYMTCAYTSETNGLLGNLSSKTIERAFRYKHDKEREFYEQFGKAPCLIRHLDFKKYIEGLRH